MTYRYQWDVNVGQTDFSGRIYTPELTGCMARAFETMMSEIGYGPQKAFDDGVVYPVAHLEADYLHPIGLNDTVTVSLESNVGTTSVSVEFEGITDDECVFQGNLTAVFIKHVSNETLSVPDPVRTGLSDL